MLDALRQAFPEKKGPKKKRHALDSKIDSLIRERRGLRSRPELDAPEKKKKRLELSKTIKKFIKQRVQSEKTEKIDSMLKDFNGVSRIPLLGRPQKKEHIASITDDEGVTHVAKAEISEVFACFYEQLYTARDTGSPGSSCHSSHIQDFTNDELDAALSGMKSGRCADESGIVAEMLKCSGRRFRGQLLELFNDILKPGSEPPDSWRKTRLVVLFKKGDQNLVKNYRPIAILPIMYKLFARMLCNRLQPTITSEQSADQAAYRKGYSTTDHLLAVTLLVEGCAEWNVDLWLGLVDFEKAFDTIEHPALWDALRALGVCEAHVVLL